MFDTELAKQQLKNLAASGNAAAARILAHADKAWSGRIDCALEDARDGVCGSAAAQFASAAAGLGQRDATAEETAQAEAQEQARLAEIAAYKAEQEAKKIAEKNLLAEVAKAESEGRVKILTQYVDDGYSGYHWDVGAIAFDASGKEFARRGPKRDNSPWIRNNL